MDNSSGLFNAENGTGGGSVVQNYFNPSNAYGVCAYNIPNYFTWSTNYSLPFGHGQHWLNHGVSSYIFGESHELRLPDPVGTALQPDGWR